MLLFVKTCLPFSIFFFTPNPQNQYRLVVTTFKCRISVITNQVEYNIAGATEGIRIKETEKEEATIDY